MFTKVFWEDFAWEHLMVGSDTQAARARGTCRSSHQVLLGTGVSARPLLCCKADEKQSSSRVPLAGQQTTEGLALPPWSVGCVRGQRARNPLSAGCGHGRVPGSYSMPQHASFPSRLLKHAYAPVKYRACRQPEGEGTDF